MVSSVLLEVSLILGFFERDLTEFLNLVMVNVKRSFAEDLVVETSLCHGGLIGSLEANESVNVLTLIVREHLKALNISELFEALLELLLSGLGREVLNVQVASFLGVLVLKHLTSSLDGSALFLKGFLNVKLVTIDFFVVKTLDSGSGGLGSVFSILLVLGVKANESVGTLVVAAKLAALDTAVSGEKFTQFLFSEVLRQVFHVDVVENTSEVTLVLRLVLDTNVRVLVDGVIKSFLGAFRSLEAHKTVATRGVIGVKRDLKTLDITILGEVFLKLLGVHVGRDLLNEEVVINESLRVGTEQLIVERKSSALASINLEVSENCTSFLELLRVRDLEDGGVERFVEISLDLRYTLKIDSGFLKKLRNLNGGVVFLG